MRASNLDRCRRAVAEVLERRSLLCDLTHAGYTSPSPGGVPDARGADPIGVHPTPRSGLLKVLVLPVRLVDDDPAPSAGVETFTPAQVAAIPARHDEIAEPTRVTMTFPLTAADGRGRVRSNTPAGE